MDKINSTIKDSTHPNCDIVNGDKRRYNWISKKRLVGIISVVGFCIELIRSIWMNREISLEHFSRIGNQLVSIYCNCSNGS